MQSALLVVITYLVVTLFGYLGHRFIHTKQAKKFNRSHMTHHVKLYPPTDYFSDRYRSAEKDDTFRTFLLLSGPLLLVPVVCCYFHLLTVFQGILVTSAAVLFGLAHDYLHDSFHIRGHWLNNFVWFRAMNARHYQHHVDMKTNYGIFFFLWDRIFGTLK